MFVFFCFGKCSPTKQCDDIVMSSKEAKKKQPKKTKKKKENELRVLFHANIGGIVPTQLKFCTE